MKIYVDADACPVVRQTEETARRFAVPVVLLCDTNHVLFSEYAEVVTVDAGADALFIDAATGHTSRVLHVIEKLREP